MKEPKFIALSESASCGDMQYQGCVFLEDPQIQIAMYTTVWGC